MATPPGIIELGSDNRLIVPDHVTIPFIEGDGVGPDIWMASAKVFDAAVKKAYGGKRVVHWVELLAGKKGHAKTGQWLPEETLQGFKKYRVGIKGPLETPVGGGIRSLNVTIRQKLDLYACIRPVKYIPGVPSPLRQPEKVNMIVFRENMEDLYAGIEWPAGTPEAARLVEFLRKEMDQEVRTDSAIGIKPMSPFNSKRLIRMAIRWAIDHRHPSVTLVHKGNILKFTEGAFRDWGYELAREEFSRQTIRESELPPDGNAGGKVIIKDRITDAMFQQILLRPDEYSVLAMPNLNGDYMSDALAAEIGGLGMAPGANIGDGIAVFEATHGTAPKYAGRDMINPGSVILSGVLMFDYLGWKEASEFIQRGLQRTIRAKIVTYDLARQLQGATQVKCSEFGRAIIENMISGGAHE
ncbi:MAG: isocitrate dehydrogenase [Deltaproteobacteria bacterium SM23_61]|nr:MAG: isocitrate dehydrogenase [Deltaproteobacteria bacterium SM23_61]